MQEDAYILVRAGSNVQLSFRWLLRCISLSVPPQRMLVNPGRCSYIMLPARVRKLKRSSVAFCSRYETGQKIVGVLLSVGLSVKPDIYSISRNVAALGYILHRT